MVCLSACSVWNSPWYTSTQFAFSFPHNSIDWSHPVYFMTGKTTEAYAIPNQKAETVAKKLPDQGNVLSVFYT